MPAIYNPSGPRPLAAAVDAGGLLTPFPGRPQGQPVTFRPKDLPTNRYRQGNKTWALTFHRPKEWTIERCKKQDEFYRSLEGVSLVSVGREKTTAWKRDAVRFPDPDDDYDHWQVAVTWRSHGKRFTNMIKMFQRTHVELAVNADDIHNYCRKEMNSFVVDNRKPCGQRTDLMELRKCAERGIPAAKVWELVPTAMLRHHKAYTVWLDALRPQRDKWTYGLWVHGPPGLGKSHAIKLCFPHAAHNPALTDNFYCGDLGKTVLIFDDQEISHFSENNVKRLLNHTQYLFNVKGGHTPMSARLVIFISNYPPPNTWDEGALSRFSGNRGWTIEWNNPIVAGKGTFPMNWPKALKGQGPGAGGSFTLPCETMDELEADLTAAFEREAKAHTFSASDLGIPDDIIVGDSPPPVAVALEAIPDDIEEDDWTYYLSDDSEDADQDDFLRPPDGMPLMEQYDDGFIPCSICSLDFRPGTSSTDSSTTCSICLEGGTRRKRNPFHDDECAEERKS